MKKLNCSVLKKENVALGLSYPIEPWFGQTYRSEEPFYTQMAAFFLPKASPLTVLTTNPIVFKGKV